MIKIKPFYRIGRAADAVFLMSEAQVHRFEPSFNGILTKLADGLDSSTLSSNELTQLTELVKLNVLYVESAQAPELCNFLEFQGWPTDYVTNQLNYHRVKVIDDHPDTSYAKAILDGLAGYNLIATDTERATTLNVYIVDVITKLTEVEYPALIVKLGSYRPSIGPVLSKRLPTASVVEFLARTKQCFEQEGFLMNLPPHLKAFQQNLMIHEILMLLLKVSNHDAIGAIVDWDIQTMKRNVWPV
jgi:hypothetical protein